MTDPTTTPGDAAAMTMPESFDPDAPPAPPIPSAEPEPFEVDAELAEATAADAEAVERAAAEAIATDAAHDPEAAPIHVAMARTMGAVRAVAKTSQHQQGWNFRGIDGVLNAVGPAMRAHGVFVVPKVLTFTAEDVEVGRDRTIQAMATVSLRYTFHGPAGDRLKVGPIIGQAMDSGDKALSKAMSVAFRTCLLQVFAIPTDEPDPDHHIAERSARRPDREPGQVQTFQAMDLLLAAVLGNRAAARTIWAGRPSGPDVYVQSGDLLDLLAEAADFVQFAGTNGTTEQAGTEQAATPAQSAPGRPPAAERAARIAEAAGAPAEAQSEPVEAQSEPPASSTPREPAWVTEGRAKLRDLEAGAKVTGGDIGRVLRGAGLPASGTKATLVQALADAIARWEQVNPPAAEAVTSPEPEAPPSEPEPEPVAPTERDWNDELLTDSAELGDAWDLWTMLEQMTDEHATEAAVVRGLSASTPAAARAALAVWVADHHPWLKPGEDVAD